MATLRDTWREDIIWHVKGAGQLYGDYHGPDEVFGLLGKFAEETGGTFRLDVHAILAGDGVLGSHHRPGRNFGLLAVAAGRQSRNRLASSRALTWPALSRTTSAAQIILGSHGIPLAESTHRRRLGAGSLSVVSSGGRPRPDT